MIHEKYFPKLPTEWDQQFSISQEIESWEFYNDSRKKVPYLGAAAGFSQCVELLRKSFTCSVVRKRFAPSVRNNSSPAIATYVLFQENNASMIYT
jgi:hypothetical protein